LRTSIKFYFIGFFKLFYDLQAIVVSTNIKNTVKFITMYISRRSATVRNALVSVVNGGVTLVILLIAPMGLAAVIINTLLVTFATYIVSTVADRVVKWLEPGGKAELISPQPGNSSSRKSKLQRWWQ
jgi:hypothetical protein